VGRSPRSSLHAGAVAALVLAGPALVAGACAKPKGSKEELCEQLPDTPALESVLAGFTTTDPDALRASVDDAIERFRDLEAAAPREIKPDVAEVVVVVEEIGEAVKEDPEDREAVADAVRSIALEHTGAAAAALRLADYASRECGIDLNEG
jgi:hypothetical protein